MPLDIQKVRAQFPLLKRVVYGQNLVYMDNAATTLKPQSVIDTVSAYLSLGTANVHRGVHYLSEQATQAYEKSRRTVQDFINAARQEEIIFTSGATAALNLVAYSYGRQVLKPGDEILLTEMEHHSDIVPWQLIAKETGAVIKVGPILDDGSLDLDAWKKLISPKTKIAAFVYISNSLGIINPVAEMIRFAKEHGVTTVVDAAQAMAHTRVDVQELGCDFLAFSGHKMFAATGVGVLYGRYELLESMPPFLGGGDMIRSVSFEGSTFSPPPARFEAGTPPIAEVLSLTPAIEFIRSLGYENIRDYELELLDYGESRLKEISGLRLIGTARPKTSILSFVMENIHPHDIGTLVDQDGIAVRTGHHCTQPIMQHFKVPATARASLSVYNTKAEIDRLADSLEKLRKIFEA
jgi:cysteine desulfurase / selenocysteine lyase